jgi:hypothetical protein
MPGCLLHPLCAACICVLQGLCAAAAVDHQAAGAQADGKQHVWLPGLQQQQVRCISTGCAQHAAHTTDMETAASSHRLAASAHLHACRKVFACKHRRPWAENIQPQSHKQCAHIFFDCLLPPRFFARPLAELITSQGRDILQSTVDLVNDMGVPGLEVSCCLGSVWSAQWFGVQDREHCDWLPAWLRLCMHM